MKNQKNKYIILIILFILLYYYRDIYFILQKLNFLIMKNISSSLRNQSITWYLIFTFLYGLIHSLAPGHGKAYIINLSLKHHLSKLIGISAIIAYTQGIISYIFIKFFIKALSELQFLDLITKNIYGITLILLSIFNIFFDKKDYKIKDSHFIIGLFFPCSGVLSVLLLGYTLNKNVPFIYLMLSMSSGVFISLSFLSFLVKKLNLTLNLKFNYIPSINIIINLLILILGIYIVI